MNHYLLTSNLTLRGFYFCFRSELKSINASNYLFFFKNQWFGYRVIGEFTNVIVSLKNIDL